MTVPNYVYLIAMGFALTGWGNLAYGEGDVTVVPTSASTTVPEQKTASTDGTPVVHKSLHKRKHPASVAATAATAPAGAASAAQNPPASSVVVTGHLQSPPAIVPAYSSPIVATVVKPPPAVSPTTIAIVRSVPLSDPTPTIIRSAGYPFGSSPLVETGLPVARYPGMGAPIKGVSTYVPPPVTLPTAPSVAGTTTRQPYYAGVLPSSMVPLTSIAAGSYSSPNHTTAPSADITFTNFSKKVKVSYPWKTGIITTEFWIGEGGSTISSTDNVASAWDANWRSTNRGTDSPNDRNGYASGEHASTVNPFYVALPFNDLAFPDKARDWVPRSWHRPPEDGKQVSACQHRWVWIKNARGQSCFAQWEDVGPLRYDHAEYVFGPERPDTYTRAGLDVSPAVAQYLGIDGNKRAFTSWRFVDDEDVPPGQWLKYDEQAVIFTAMHQLKNGGSSPDLPIQRATEPIDDQNNDSNKKRVEASKG
jgi:hypothetical protein